MDLKLFCEKHQTSLEQDQAKFNLILGLIDRGKAGDFVRLWSLGSGASCAIQTPPRYIVLGELDDQACELLAKQVFELDFKGCIGPTNVASRFSSALSHHGVNLQEHMPQRIYTLNQPPLFPRCEGSGRSARPEDENLFIEWFKAFCQEAMPEETPLPMDQIKKLFLEKPTYFWTVNQKPVAMAAINRETKEGANISFVYTPPPQRGKGYGGSATAYASEAAFQNNKKVCFLYADLRNPISNRVYIKLGFKPSSDATSYIRKL